MAVEAHHINLFPPQFPPNSEVCNAQIDSSLLPLQIPVSSSSMADPFLPFYQSSTACDLAASAKTSINKADSGLTCHIPTAPPIRKRSRDHFDESNALSIPHKLNKFPSQSPPSFLDHEFLFHLHNQQSDIDHFISQHTEKVRVELQKQRVRQSRALISGIQEAMAKKLKEKDEEIQRMGKLNWVLQERVKSLCVENQIWRELAHTNEATANSLRSNLEQVLAHVGGAGGDGGAEADDAASSCGSNYCEEDAAAAAAGRRCRKCGEGESAVLLLPCRHLCLCTMCGSTVRNCPVCHSRMNATVHVNFS